MSVDAQIACAGSGWFTEQALDVESSHAMAPGAHILYVGAKDCFNNSLLAADTTAITSGASVVSNSWDDATGNCATRNVSLTTGPGFDSMTGMGSINSRFVPTISKY